MTTADYRAGPGRACKMRARVGHELYTAGSGFCGPGLIWWLGVAAGLGLKPGPCGLGLLVYVVKARVRMLGSGLGK
jgi:hypothetical protein